MRSILVAVLAGIGLSIGMAYAQLPQLKPHFDDPSAPYSFHSVAGAQYGLSVTSSVVVTLTVPAGAVCASISVNTATVHRTTDGVTAPTTTKGTLLAIGNQSSYDCGPLANYKYIAASSSATLDVEYFY